MVAQPVALARGDDDDATDGRPAAACQVGLPVLLDRVGHPLEASVLVLDVLVVRLSIPSVADLCCGPTAVRTVIVFARIVAADAVCVGHGHVGVLESHGHVRVLLDATRVFMAVTERCRAGAEGGDGRVGGGCERLEHFVMGMKKRRERKGKDERWDKRTDVDLSDSEAGSTREGRCEMRSRMQQPLMLAHFANPDRRHGLRPTAAFHLQSLFV